MSDNFLGYTPDPLIMKDELMERFWKLNNSDKIDVQYARWVIAQELLNSQNDNRQALTQATERAVREEREKARDVIERIGEAENIGVEYWLSELTK